MLLPPRAPLIRNSALGTGVPHENYTPSSHINDADFVTETAGTIASAVADAAFVLGIAEHDSNANWGGQAVPPAAQNIQNVLGASNVGLGGLVSPSPKQTIVATLGPNIGVEMSLTATTGWITGGAQQANLGTLVGLAIDATTGYYLADPTASNLIGRIFAKPFAPNGPFGGGSGFAGDLGARVLVEFLPAYLQATQGE
jgi:hypothetical protein